MVAFSLAFSSTANFSKNSIKNFIKKQPLIFSALPLNLFLRARRKQILRQINNALRSFIKCLLNDNKIRKSKKKVYQLPNIIFPCALADIRKKHIAIVGSRQCIVRWEIMNEISTNIFFFVFFNEWTEFFLWARENLKKKL